MNTAKTPGCAVLAQRRRNRSADVRCAKAAQGERRPPWKGAVGKEQPFGEPRSVEEPRELELRRAEERDRGRQATHPLQIPWRGWYDIIWRTYREMNSDRVLSIAGGRRIFSFCLQSFRP